MPCRSRGGFALPIALFMLVVTALMAAALLDGAVQELRTARGDLAEARARAAAGTALADLLSSAPDNSLLDAPRGVVSTGFTVSGAETTHVTLQSLGNGALRITASARAWSGGVRGDAANVGFARIVPDGGGAPGSLRYQRLPGWWWAQIP